MKNAFFVMNCNEGNDKFVGPFVGNVIMAYERKTLLRLRSQ